MPDLDQLAEGVRETQQGTSGMKQLVFNPETGDFDLKPRSSLTGRETVVTNLTKDGFASV